MKIEPDGLEMRFSLRGLLIVLTGVSVCSALLFSVPDSIGLLLLIFLAVAVPAALTAGAVYRRGGLVGVQFRVYSASAWLMIALLGGLVVIVRRIATR